MKKYIVILFLIFTIPLFAQLKRAPLWEWKSSTRIGTINLTDTLLSPRMITPTLGAATGTSLALGGATLGSNVFSARGLWQFETGSGSSATDSSIVWSSNSGSPLQTFYGTDGDSWSLGVNTSDRALFSGATGYSFDGTIESAENIIVGGGTAITSTGIRLLSNVWLYGSNDYLELKNGLTPQEFRIFSKDASGSNDRSMRQYWGTDSTYYNTMTYSGTALIQPYKFVGASSYSFDNNMSFADPGTSANSYSISLVADNTTTAQTGSIQVMYGADPYMRFSAPNDAGTATAIMDLKDQRVVIGSSGAGVDYDIYFQGETNQGNITYMEDEDRFDFDNDVKVGGEFWGTTVNNQFSNYLSGDLLGITTPEFLNTLVGTPATDAANMIDVSGAGHNGTYKGTWAAAQKLNKGFGWILNPNGTDNYIDLGDADDFSFGTGAADIAFSVAGIIEITTTGTNRMVFSKWDATTGTELREYQLYLGTDDKFYFIFFDESANVQAFRSTDAAIANGFRTFVITYDGGGGATAANGITIYIDGAVVASTATNNASYVAMENLATSVFIGTRTGASAKELFMPTDFTPPIFDKTTVWTAAQVNRFHQYMKGQFNL